MDQSPSTVAGAPKIDFRTAGRLNWLFSDYRTPVAQPSRAGNSDRVARLIRDGKLQLTLQDAIQLAIENNFDVELRRYDLAVAETEILRAKGGGQLRGVPTSISELPSGEGGPGEPLLTAVGGYTPVVQLPSSSADLATITGTQSDLSILSATPYSAGSGIPAFDPSVSANVALSQTVYPQSDAFSTGSNYFSSHTLGGSALYSQGFSTGTVLSASLQGNRLNEASTRLNLNPFVSGSLNVSVVQPLLRGFGIHVNRRFISIAKSESSIEADVFRQQLIATISDVTRLYWDLVSLQQDLRVKHESLLAAERLNQDTKNEVDLGTQAPVDLTSAMAQVASNRQALINAQGLVLQQELLLKEVLTRKGISDSSVASASIDALTQIAPPVADQTPQLADLLDSAMKQRPDLALAEAQEQSSRAALTGSRNALLPEFNLIASMQNNGGAGTVSANLVASSGTTSTAPPSNLVGGYGSVLGQIFRRDFPDYTVGAQVSIPVRNRIARADAARDDIQYRQSEVRVQQLRSQVRLQVGNAYIAMQQASESYHAAVEARRLQEEALDVQQAKFEAGVATAYEVLQYQSGVAEARSAEVSALGVYAKAKSALQRATGATLIDNGITIDTTLSPR
ncbi:TolC family protein [Bryocella elongata]|nr:TolC family protein [Bryocella elongata]